MSLQPRQVKERRADNFRRNEEKFLCLNLAAHETVVHEKKKKLLGIFNY